MKLLALTNKPNRASRRQRISIYTDILKNNGISCKITTFPSGAISRLKLLKKFRSFDAIFLQKKRLGILYAILVRHFCSKLIYDFDDAVMYNDKSPEKDCSVRKRRFKRTVKLADLVVAGNQYLAEHAMQFNKNVKVVPTGLDTKAYKTDITPEADGVVRLVWIGSKGTLMYLNDLKPALEDIGSSYKNVSLRIICNCFFDLKNMPVEKYVWSVDTQAADLAACDIGLAPLPEDKFTKGKCGFKILQYQACGLPVVASPVGVNAEYVIDGINGFHAQNRQQWFEKTAQLIEDSQLRKQMGLKGKEAVEQFDLQRLGEKLSGLIKTCVK